MKTSNKALTTAAGELRSNLTDAELKRFASASEVLPGGLQAVLGMRKRGAQKAPTKVATSIRLSPNVLDTFKATGKGWQSRIDDALQTYLREHPTRS